jgi:uncharacterized tellurite resistance protein B-like protein
VRALDASVNGKPASSERLFTPISDTTAGRRWWSSYCAAILRTGGRSRIDPNCEIVNRVKSFLRSWLGVEQTETDTRQDALRDLLDALERLDPDRAQYLARFAYLLGHAAHADQHVSPQETQTMEQLVAHEGGIPPEQAMLVVGLAKTSALLFAGTDDFIVARDFAAVAGYEQKLSLVRCLFAVAAAEGRISIEEEREIQRIARALRVEASDIVALRLEYRQHLPGMSGREPE